MKLLAKQINERIKEIESDEKYALMESGYNSKNMAIQGIKFGAIDYYPPKPKVQINPSSHEKAIEFLQEEGLVEVTPAKGWEDRFAIINGSIIDTMTGENCDDIFTIGQTPARCVSRLERKVTLNQAMNLLQPQIGNGEIRALLEG